MIAADIVAQLAVKLPQYTDKFTDNITVTGISRVGSVATATTSVAHGLTVGAAVNITGAQSPISITSLTRAGTVGTLVTATPHDLTDDMGVDSVELSGSVEVEFNGTFTILTRPNRNTVTFAMADAGPTVATGSPLLLNGSSFLQGYNGLFSVLSVPTTTTFTYNLTTTPLLTDATGTIFARIKPRISTGVSLERILDAYTAQITDSQYWLFVILGDVTASKSRSIDSDAVDNLQPGNHWRQQIIQPFTVAVVMPTANEIAASNARDAAEVLFKPICQSLLGVKFDSQLSLAAKNPVIFTDHGTVAYNTAIYVHSYAFQQVADMSFNDTIGHDDSVAFRDIVVDMYLDVGTGADAATATIDLDDVPL